MRRLSPPPFRNGGWAVLVLTLVVLLLLFLWIFVVLGQSTGELQTT